MATSVFMRSGDHDWLGLLCSEASVSASLDLGLQACAILLTFWHEFWGLNTNALGPRQVLYLVSCLPAPRIFGCIEMIIKTCLCTLHRSTPCWCSDTYGCEPEVGLLTSSPFYRTTVLYAKEYSFLTREQSFTFRDLHSLALLVLSNKAHGKI